jgi:hypothetical protein
MQQSSSGANDQAATPRQTEQDERSGRDIPGGTGLVGDEDVKDITDSTQNRNREGGQDHSLENYEETMPDHGVGAVQDYSDTTTDVARIDD